MLNSFQLLSAMFYQISQAIHRWRLDTLKSFSVPKLSTLAYVCYLKL